jgi:phosphoribosylanthranilate isomerase
MAPFMSPDIKICGLKTGEAVEAALSGGASYVGFIFFPKSPRNIVPEAAGKLRVKARNRAKAVAVTVDADDAFLDHIMHGMEPDMLQLHGKESPARVAEVKRRYGLPVIKALSVSSAEDIGKARPYAGIADFIMFDAKAPKGSELPGGNGVSFDWSLLRAVGPDLPYFLAGGADCRKCWRSRAHRPSAHHRHFLRRRNRSGRQGSGPDPRFLRGSAARTLVFASSAATR